MAQARQMESQRPLDEVEKVIGGFRVLLNRVNKDWKKPNNRVLGHVLRAPAIHERCW